MWRGRGAHVTRAYHTARSRELGRYKPPPGYEVEEGGDGAS